MLRDGKAQDASIFLEDLWLIELSDLLKTEDGETPNAMLELVSIQNELNKEEIHDKERKTVFFWK